jgi:class 3 adenylate cyclase
MLPDKASGTLTFLFTDLEGSTRLWERFPQAMRRALERHDSILLTAVTAAGGQVVKTTGDGLMAVFGSAADAVRACLAAQRGLVEEPWQETGALRVRMGLHSGEAQLRGGTTTSVLR